MKPGALQFARGGLSTAELKVVEDDAVDDALRLQGEAGVEVVTDGEMRRLSFQSQLPAAVDGFSHGISVPSCGATGTATTRSAICGSSAPTWR